MQADKFNPLIVTDAGKTFNLAGRIVQSKTGGGVRYDYELINHTKRPLKIARVRLCELPFGKSVRIFRQGFYMPSDPAGFYELTAGKPAPAPGRWPPLTPWCDDHTFISHSLAVVRHGARPLLTAGFVSFDRFEGIFTFDTRSRTVRMAAWCLMENISLPPGAACRLESLWLLENRDFNRSLTDYADCVGRINHALIPRETVTGWVDWQYYREEKNERDILRSVRAMQTLKQRGYPLKYVIIDGGWCAYASEWMQPCAKFPDMPGLCRKIRRAGFVPGLWLAPYITNVKTEVARRHPDWMVIDCKTGKPLFKERSNVGACHVLDFTVPAALDWLRKIVRTMVRDWGVGYIKLDGPNPTHYLNGRFHVPDVTGIELMRRAMQVVREESGDKVLVEGEGIYGPSIGYVDIQRTTQDTSTRWHILENGHPLLKENLKNDLLSGFVHRRMFHNHRENVVLRDFLSPFHAGTAKNPAARDAILTENQLRSQISATALAGGAMLLSDPVELLLRSPGRLALISRFLPHFENQPPAQPLDVFQDGRQPAIYHLPVERDFESWHVAGIFNWDDHPADCSVPLHKITGGGDWHAFEFWNGEYLGAFGRQMAVCNVPAHGCRILALRRKLNRPQLVGTNLHILQGAVEIGAMAYLPAKKTLRLAIKHFDQHERRLFIWRPASFRRVRVQSNAQDWLVDDRRSDLLIVQFNGRQGRGGCRKTEFDLRFG